MQPRYNFEASENPINSGINRNQESRIVKMGYFLDIGSQFDLCTYYIVAANSLTPSRRGTLRYKTLEPVRLGSGQISLSVLHLDRMPVRIWLC